MVADADGRSTRATGEPHRTIWFGRLLPWKRATMSERTELAQAPIIPALFTRRAAYANSILGKGRAGGTHALQTVKILDIMT